MPEDRGGIPVLGPEPEKRIGPVFVPDDPAGLTAEELEEMGFRDMDDFCREHIQ